MAPDESGPLQIIMLRKRGDFVRTRSGRHWSSDTLTLQAMPNSLENPLTARIGFTVTRKVGNSVERNRIKRRLREAVRHVLPEFGIAGFDYVLIGKRSILHSRFAALKQDLQVALDHVHSNRAKVTELG